MKWIEWMNEWEQMNKIGKWFMANRQMVSADHLKMDREYTPQWQWMIHLIAIICCGKRILWWMRIREGKGRGNREGKKCRNSIQSGTITHTQKRAMNSMVKMKDIMMKWDVCRGRENETDKQERNCREWKKKGPCNNKKKR